MIVGLMLATIALLVIVAWRDNQVMCSRARAFCASSDAVDGALMLTRARLARGEISAEEFDRIAAVLRS